MVGPLEGSLSMRWVLVSDGHLTFAICEFGPREAGTHLLTLLPVGSVLSCPERERACLDHVVKQAHSALCARRPHWSALTTNHCRIDLRSPAYRTSNTVSRSLDRPSSALGRWLLVRNQPTIQTDRQAASGSSTSPSSPGLWETRHAAYARVQGRPGLLPVRT